MKSLYFDQAATSFPKAPGVGKAMLQYLTANGANINRGSYNLANEAAMVVLETREALAQLFHCTEPVEQVIFTPGCTWGLNMLLRGYLSAGDHVIVSSLEHNAVMRPLVALAEKGISFSRIPADTAGVTKAEDMLPLIKENTKLVVVSHASNVSGTIFPLTKVAALCREHHLPLVVDGAQTAGHLDIDFDSLHLAALCVPGHKGLMGPQGIGAVLLQKAFAQKLAPLITGGTGSASDSECQPNFLPDKFESGTLNLPGIYGLNAALKYISQVGLPKLQHNQKQLLEKFLALLQPLPVRIVGPGDSTRQVGVVSLDFPNRDNGMIAFQLEQKYGVLTRCGLHCAPNAHKTLQTFPQGTVRFSLGNFTTENDLQAAVAAIKELCTER